MNNVAYLSLGTNLGERELNLRTALEMLESQDGIHIVKRSSIYETDPVGYTEQDSFLNMVAKIETSMTVEELLHQCLQVEEWLGRVREFRWGPRIIDLDILLYNQENIETENLIIPHPRMHERNFVLVPLLEIEPDICFPVTGIPLKQIADSIQEGEGVRLWKQINGEDVYVLSGS